MPLFFSEMEALEALKQEKIFRLSWGSPEKVKVAAPPAVQRRAIQETGADGFMVSSSGDRELLSNCCVSQPPPLVPSACAPQHRDGAGAAWQE